MSREDKIIAALAILLIIIPSFVFAVYAFIQYPETFPLIGILIFVLLGFLGGVLNPKKED